MPNHWHLVVQARRRTRLSTWMQWVSVTHTHRWHQHYHTAGQGPLYQGRFKSFPVQEDEHLLTLLRYVEGNALRAGLVERAQEWRWGSLWARRAAKSSPAGKMLGELPIDLPRNWAAVVNAHLPEKKLEAVRQSVIRGRPLGEERWSESTVKRLGLGMTQRPRGRPKGREIAAEGVGNSS